MKNTEWQVISVPIAAGVDATTPQRHVGADALTRAENMSFSRRVGTGKRNGHTFVNLKRVLSSVFDFTAYPRPNQTCGVADGRVALPTDYTYANGVTRAYRDVSGVTVGTGFGNPDAAHLNGAYTRDSQLLASSPDTLYTPDIEGKDFLPQEFSRVVIRPSNTANRATKQTKPCYSSTGKYEVIAWLDYATGSAVATWSVYDKETKNAVALNVADSGATSPTWIRLVEGYEGIIFICVFSSSNNLTTVRKIDCGRPTTSTAVTTIATRRFMQVKRVSLTDIVLITGKTNTYEWITYGYDLNFTASANVVALAGVTNNTSTSSGTVYAGDFVSHKTDLPIPTSMPNYCTAVLWNGPPGGDPSVVGSYDFASGAAVSFVSLVDDRPSSVTLSWGDTAATRGLDGGNYRPINLVMWLGCGRVHTETKEGCWTRTYSITPDAAAITWSLLSTAHGTTPASGAWNVGDRHFCTLVTSNRDFVAGDGTSIKEAGTAANSLDIQSSYQIMDAYLKPVGQLELGSAYYDDYDTAAASSSSAENYLPTVKNRWSGSLVNGQSTYQTETAYTFCLPYNERVGVNPTVAPVFTEPSVRRIELDYLAQPQAAQMGRTLYFPGGMLWGYDGQTLGEGVFLQDPEFVVGERAAGTSHQAGSYSYKVYACRYNSQGELIRSSSTPVSIAISTANQSVRLRIYRQRTRYDDVFFMVYRTEMDQQIHYLVSSPDLSNAQCPKNPASGTRYVDFNDTTADATLLTSEQDPEAGNDVVVSHPPPSEFITYGKDRLFLYGGAIPAGTIAPSLYFQTGKVPQFSGDIHLLVDRGFSPITGVATHNELLYCWKDTATYVVEGDGPDNFGNGEWLPARLVSGSHGCISPFSLAVSPAGPVYASDAGLYLIQGMNPQHFGWPVDAVVDGVDFVGCVVVPKENEIRWYLSNGKVAVFNLDLQRWSTFTGLECNGVTVYGGRAVLARPHGDIWTETEDVYNDAGRGYQHRIRTGNLAGSGVGANQRVRRAHVWGDVFAAATKVTVHFYSDEMSAPHTTHVWTPTTDTTQSQVGGFSFTETIYKDGLLGRPGGRSNVQRSSYFAVEVIVDSDNNKGFSPTAVVYEVAGMTGTSKGPAKE